MDIKKFSPLILFIAFFLVVSLACNFMSSTPTDAPDVPAATEEIVETEQPVETEDALPEPTAGAVDNLQDVKNAVVQIEAQGTFIDPEIGLVANGAGSGSGFIIDPSGLAVTNNHVVTGAALLKVWVGGETEPRNARVVAVSECSDLAVIKIDGDDFDYLEWHSGPIDVGMDIYVAGFPLGDPEFTLNKGIVSKSQAGGETSWSSVDSVIEYDATSNPGNSGGPIVTPDGRVVAVHYAGNASVRQAFGISRDVARNVIQVLENGENLNSIGINGQAVGSEDGSITGIWVASVESGSPADQAGVRPGDILTMMENLVLATDGSMSQYCDVLRSHTPEETLSLQVLRWSTGEVLEGQINGRDLEVVYTDGSDTTETVDTGTGSIVVDLNASEPGDPYLVTDFDDTEGWYTFTVPDNTSYTAEDDAGLVYVQVDDTNSTVYMVYDLDLPVDVQIDAAVETVAGPNRNNISLVCRATADGWYEFSMNSGGYWYIWKYDDGQYTELSRGASYAINLQKENNELTATCIGKELAFYVNSTEMGKVFDNRFKGGGQVGVSVSTFDIPGAGVEFDWFVASVP